jgi:glycerol transport system permease protein
MKKSINNRGWLFVLPALLLLSFVAVVPLMSVATYSFYDVFTLEAKVWVGLEWYQELLSSARFYETLGRSLLFSAVVLAFEIPLGIAIALSMPKKGATVAVCLVSMSLPLLVPWNMIAVIWHVFLEMMTVLLSIVGIEFDWKLHALHTWFSIVLMDIWHWTSLVVLLCYAGLTTIPAAFYSAAAIDSASRWQVFRYVELPRIKKVLLMAILLRFIDSFMVFTEPFRLNAGGPRSSTTFLAMELDKDIVAFNYGPASAKAILYFMLIVLVSWIFTILFADREPDNHSKRKAAVAREQNGKIREPELHGR